jgi:hypothetical protein
MAAGEWREGTQHGKGVYTWANGDRYEGGWKDGNLHGHGSKVPYTRLDARSVIHVPCTKCMHPLFITLLLGVLSSFMCVLAAGVVERQPVRGRVEG